MEFLQPYINIWKNFAKFDGRTGVRGFWMAFVVNMIIGLLFGFLTQISGIFGILSSAYSLAVLVPWWALMFRRLHDHRQTRWVGVPQPDLYWRNPADYLVRPRGRSRGKPLWTCSGGINKTSES